MSRLLVVIKPTASWTRVLWTDGERDLLKAVLPPPAQAHPRAASLLLEALSLWVQRPLYAVLCADATGCSSALGLCDGFGFGNKTVHFEVEVYDRSRVRRGLGAFRDLHEVGRRGLQ